MRLAIGDLLRAERIADMVLHQFQRVDQFSAVNTISGLDATALGTAARADVGV